ncbi:MAG: rRNA pseudouridine synthase [Oscillospiraceae bacterium]|nr:rRNA pseudouridine synthase [Candidatus Ruminococcus equi]
MNIIRLDKFISSQTGYSRKEVHKLVKDKVVRVNGIVCTTPDFKVNTECDKVTLNGENISYEPYVYYMMNKPGGVLSASEDKHQKTVLDLLPEEYRRNGLFPAGRLDKDTTGFLLITNDGDFAHKMLSPSKHVYKEYIVTTDKELSDELKLKFSEGIKLLDGTKFKPAYFEKIGDNTARVRICEGKFHQIKKMFSACSYIVVELKRVKIGGLSLDESLDFGETKKLSKDEIGQIFE